jgi:hypothetical protein
LHSATIRQSVQLRCPFRCFPFDLKNLPPRTASSSPAGGGFEQLQSPSYAHPLLLVVVAAATLPLEVKDKDEVAVVLVYIDVELIKEEEDAEVENATLEEVSHS